MAENVAAPNPPTGVPATGREQTNRPPNASGAGKQASGPGKSALIAIGAIILLAVLLAIGILPRLRQNKQNNARAHAAASDIPKVTVVKPQPAPDTALTLPGSTQAIADAQVGARATGYVRRRYVDIGAHVRAGQVLAEIESPDVDQQLSQANAQVAQSQATVQQSQADVANRQATVAQYRANVRQAQANLESSRAALANAKAKLAQLEAAEKTAEAQRDQAQQNVGIKQAALRQANTQLQLAQLTYQRYQTLLKAGYVALQDVDQNRAAFENAQSAVNSAQADVGASQKAVDAAQANVRSAQANIASGQAEVSAAEKNVGAVAETISAARATVNAAQATVRQSQSTVTANQYAQVANQANSKRFAVLTGFEKVVAPFDGVITARNIDVGSLVNAGGGAASGASTGGSTSSTSVANVGSASTTSATPNTASASGLFGLARTDVLRILVPVPQAFAALMRPGITTHVTLREFPGRTFDGLVTNVAGALDSVSRTRLTEVHLPNQKGELLPGMFAQIAFDLPKFGTGMVVPATALLFDGQGTRVALVGAENKVHFMPVRMGRDFNTQVEVIEGVKPDDTVLANPSDDLKEGEKIQPVFPPPPGQPPAGAPASQAAPGKKTPPPRGGNPTSPQ